MFENSVIFERHNISIQVKKSHCSNRECHVTNNLSFMVVFSYRSFCFEILSSLACAFIC